STAGQFSLNASAGVGSGSLAHSVASTIRRVTLDGDEEASAATKARTTLKPPPTVANSSSPIAHSPYLPLEDDTSEEPLLVRDQHSNSDAILPPGSLFS